MGCPLTVMEQLNRSNCPEERKTSGELPSLKEEKTPELNILETDVRTKRGIFRTKQMKASNIGTRGRARSFSLETHTQTSKQQSIHGLLHRAQLVCRGQGHLSILYCK